MDTNHEPDETVIATLSIFGTPPSDVTLGTSTHTHTIRNDDTTSQPTASFASASSSAAEDAGTRNVTVNLSSAAPSGGLSLSYSVTGTATAGSGNDFHHPELRNADDRGWNNLRDHSGRNQ